jgi:mono/diheme cytochrome c family protein
MCSDCHGATGDGVEGKGPDIKHPIRDYSEWVVRNGRSEEDDAYGVFALYYDEDMEAFPTVVLSDAMLQGVFDYLDTPPQPTTGQGLYEDYCSACHGPDAQGGLTDRPIAAETAEFLDNVRSGHHPGEFSNRHDHMAAQSANELSDAEIQLIADYVSSL